MELLGREVARDLLLLSLAAGSADAIGYLSLGNVFTSNMTGNLVLLGIDLGQGQVGPATRHVFVLAIFILGSGLGAWLGRDLPEKKWAALAFRLIWVDKILLLIFGIAWFFNAKANGAINSYVLLVPLAIAMGLQSTALFRLSAPGVATTAITGTFTALTNGLVRHLLLPKADAAETKSNLSRIQFQLSVILLYATGAILSGFLIMHGIAWVGFLPILAAAFVSFGRARA
jgi:uncharacterized membrane protein YoaK (UPF0700 family)